jgi:8-oxo-dGTP pyrophosphatase MutT (NUDIX family)
MQIVYIGDPTPNQINKTVYLAGTASNINNWRQKAIEILRLLEYDGIVFVPQWKENTLLIDSEKERKWEEKCVAMSDHILFYFDRDIDNNIIGIESTDLFGKLKDNKNVVLVTNPNAKLVDYQITYVKEHNIPHFQELYNGIKHIINQQTDIIRRDGERFIPQFIWKTPQFNSWYKSHQKLGNWISDARLLISHGTYDFIFAYTLWVNIFIKSENRFKNNEFIISRTDIASCVIFKRAEQLVDTEIILVSEFRTPVNNESGVVLELPGGSSNNNVSMTETVLSEIKEETGFNADPQRLTFHNSAQTYATMLTHHSHLYSYELDDIEYNIISMNNNKTFGNIEETEYTTVKIMKLGEILNNNNIDWTTIGQILTVMN